MFNIVFSISALYIGYWILYVQLLNCHKLFDPVRRIIILNEYVNKEI